MPVQGGFPIEVQKLLLDNSRVHERQCGFQQRAFNQLPFAGAVAMHDRGNRRQRAQARG